MNVHTLSLLIRHEPSVLARVVVLFCTRDVEVNALSLGPAGQDGIARLEVAVDLLDGRPVEQLVKQLGRLVDVVRVDELVDPGGEPHAGGAAGNSADNDVGELPAQGVPACPEPPASPGYTR